ncbi:MAG: STAS domain-containing protein [Opitutales bacterium]|jgi:anti-anti-sigma factor
MFEILEKTETLAVVALSGRVDSAAARLLETEFENLVQSGRRFLVLDLAAVTLLASDGLKLLLRVEVFCKRSEGALALAAVPEAVVVVLELAGFAPYFPRFPDVATARTRLEG